MTLKGKQVPVLYCDIDGTIRYGKDELGRFVNTAEDVQVFPEVPDLLWGYKDLGWRIIGVSNQAGIGLGYMEEQDCILAMMETDRQTRMAFDKIVYCPHKPDAHCDCRKPEPGMVFNARQWLFQNNNNETYPMKLGLFVGDRPEDEGVAFNAGLEFIEAGDWRRGEHLDKLVKVALG